MTSSTICSHHRIRTVLLMCVVLLSASLHAQAQNKETRINLNIRNATLESFVKQLENATGFSFIYGEEVKLTHRITLEMKQKNISEILQRAFENEPITFEISGKHILLHKRPVPQKPVSRKFTISGYVTDGASSETLIGANILESRRSTGTATNPFGFYSLTLPEGETELVFSYLGYESRHSRFELTKDTLLNVRLDSNNQLAEVVVLSDKREAGIESTAMGAHESRYGRFCRHVCARGRSRPKPGYAGRDSSLQRRPPAGSILHLYARSGKEHHTLQKFFSCPLRRASFVYSRCTDQRRGHA